MPKQLKDIEIQFISLVKKGANKRTIIFKSADDDNPPITFDIPISKTNDEKHMVYGIVYIPDSVDTQGDFAKAEDIEKAAHHFMKNLKNLNIDKGHSYQHENAFVAESWILRKSDPLFPNEKPGAWAVGIKVDDLELWNDVKKGEIAGLSMAGKATKIVRKSDEDATIIEKLKDLLGIKTKKGEEDMEKTEVEGIVKEAIEKAQKDTLTKEDVTTIVKTAIEAIVKPINDKIEKLGNSTNGSKQDDEKIKKADKEKDEKLVKMGEAIAKSVMGEED